MMPEMTKQEAEVDATIDNIASNSEDLSFNVKPV